MTPEEIKTRLDYRVRIEMTGVQARLAEKSLSLFIGLALGRVEDAAEILSELHKLCRDERLFDAARTIKTEVLGLHWCGNLGISSPKVDQQAKAAYDMVKALQKAIATTERHDGWSVWHDGDLLHLGGEPTPEVTVIRDGVETAVDVATHKRR